MAFIFTPDGNMEAAEYENNYRYFNGKDPKALEEAMAIARRRGRYPTQRTERRFGIALVGGWVGRYLGGRGDARR